MATSCNYFCSLCQEDDEISLAVKWCAECEVFLCPECQKHHGRSKTSKHHQVMSVQDYQHLPDFMLKVKNNCEEHDLKYELFCSFHDAACCMKCIKDKHDNCKGLVPLGEVFGNIKSSAYMSQVEKDLIGLLENLKIIQIFFSENLESLQKQKAEGIGKVHKIRQSINEHLDRLEKRLLNDIESEFTKTRDEIRNLQSEIESKTTQFEQQQRDFTKMVEFSTNLQIYFGLHKVDKIIKEEEKYINDLMCADILCERNMNIELSLDLESKFPEVKMFGKVLIGLSPYHLQLKTKVGGQVQSPQIPVLSKIKPTIKQRFKMPYESVRTTGCQILPEGGVLFIEQENKSLLLFSNNGVFEREVLKFQNIPSDLCYVGQNEVAITFHDIKNVYMIDFENNKIVKKKIISGPCYGICSFEQMIYVRVMPNSILMLDFDFNVKNRIKLLGTSVTRIAVFRDKLYCTDWNNSTVMCYNKAGEKLWSKNCDIINPFGIDVDRNGFVYVACKGNNNITALSPDGTESKVIISVESGLKAPFALNIHRDLSLLVVSNESNTSSFLLSIENV